MSINTRVGIGYDIHPLVSGRKLILGGVEIPYEKGLDGWSDADVLTHAVIDALLGAAALGDIGQHFPAGDLDWKEALSLFLLDKVVKKLDGRGYRIGNIDVTVVAEQPYLHDYIGKMRENLSETLRIDLDNVSVKASSNNGIGSIGAGEGIAAYAVAMIEEFKNLKPKPGN
jgi:2-C-methyl-D-erythritol 2,4-cyclodiphosphate synthase